MVAIANRDLGSTSIRFPEDKRIIPLPTSSYKKENYAHDDPLFSFATSIRFPEDEYILDYLWDRGDETEGDRTPPAPDEARLHGIGFIYLTVYQDLRAYSGSVFTSKKKTSGK